MLAERHPKAGAGSPAPRHATLSRFGDWLRPHDADAARETWPRDAAMLARYAAELRLRPACAEAGLQVVDLAPGGGERAWQVLRLLADSVAGLRYLAVCANEAARRSLAQQPALQHALQCGQLRLVLRPGDEAAWRAELAAATPLAILAHGWCATQRQDLYACHYGQWLEAWVETAPGREPALAWRAAETDTPLARGLAPQYLRSLNSAVVSLPSGAVAALAPLLSACDGRYLLLASDAAVADLAEIRAGALTPRAVARDAVPAVNFHALGGWLGATGAQWQSCDEGLAACARWLLAVADDDRAGAATIAAEVASAWQATACDTEALTRLAQQIAHPDEQTGAAMPAPAGEAQAFALWRASGFAPELLRTLLGPLQRGASAVCGQATQTWLHALQASWSRYFPPLDDDGFFAGAATIAAALGRWGAALELLESEAGLYGHSPESLRLRLHCLERAGLTQTACALLEAPLPAAFEPALGPVRQTLTQRLARWSALPWFAAEHARQQALCLEPLGDEHAEAFLFQYRDPQIGMMTRLPEFADRTELGQWMDERMAAGDRYDYAIVHADYGFVGALSAHHCGSDAFCHFWIGTDFQGQGYVLPALRLFFAQISRIGIKRVFTTAYPDNFRSLHVLQRAGFSPLAERALAPEAAMPFFAKVLDGQTYTAAVLGAALREHCARSGGVFVFAPSVEQAS